MRARTILGLTAATAGLLLTRELVRSCYRFEGRVVLITGGSRGLGFALARAFACRGCRVVVLGRDAGQLELAEAELRRHGQEVLALGCDVRQRQEIDTAVATVRRRFGRLDILVNNAGTITVGPLEDQRDEDLQQAVDIDLWAPWHAMRAALPELRKARGGRIVNIASIGGLVGVPHLGSYCAGKHGLVGLSACARHEWARHGIAVTTVCPWLTRTGSGGRAQGRGATADEEAWFRTAAGSPLLTQTAERAAEQIVRACQRGQARLVLTPMGKAAQVLDHLLPGLMAVAMRLFAALLPAPPAEAPVPVPGESPQAPRRMEAHRSCSDSVKQAIS